MTRLLIVFVDVTMTGDETHRQRRSVEQESGIDASPAAMLASSIRASKASASSTDELLEEDTLGILE
jgi:hypothetical protein